MMYHFFFTMDGLILQNLGKDFIRTNMHSATPSIQMRFLAKLAIKAALKPSKLNFKQNQSLADYDSFFKVNRLSPHSLDYSSLEKKVFTVGA